MRRFLLFVAAAVITLSASAQSLSGVKVGGKSKTLPEAVQQSTMKKGPRKATEERTIVEIPSTATQSLYSASYYQSSWFGMAYLSGVATQVYTDGDDIYFKDLFHSLYYMPVKGTKQADGSIVIKKQMIYEGIDYNGDGSEYDDLYFTLITVDDEGNAEFPDDDIVLQPTEDGGYTIGGTIDEPVYYGLCDQYGYYWFLAANLDIEPYTPSSEEVELPDGAVVKEASFKYKYYNMEDVYTATTLSNMSVDGETVYLEGLCPDATAWVKGTIKDGKLCVPTNQFLGADGTYLLEFQAGKNYTYTFEWIDEDNWEYTYYENYDPADEITFTNVDGKWVLDEGQCIVELMADGSTFGIYFDEAIKEYAGDVPAVPADPTVLLEDYTDLVGAWVLQANVAAEDVNGEYIRPENMEIALWEDGDIMTFTADDGYYLSEEITWMPYGWTDDAGGYDLAFLSMTPAFYLYEDLFEKIGAQVRYTVDGVTNYSSIVYMDTEGNTEVVTGVKGINETTKQNNIRYNIAGQRVGNEYKGIIIRNGKKYLK